jgi:beta-phosphoglucomutase-like phosphatase (HAD superfamily)
VVAVAGVYAAIDSIDVPTSLLSTGPMPKMPTTLGVRGLLPRFAGRLFTPDSGLPGKPLPDLSLAAAAAAGADPRRTAVVEDTATGARGARAAGMTVFGYVGGGRIHADALLAEGALLFEDMRELPALLLQQAN